MIQLNYQNSASLLMEQLFFSWFSYFSYYFNYNYHYSIMLNIKFIFNRFLFEGQMIELIWTILPAITFIFIALPSLRLLYLLDELMLLMMNYLITLKSIGDQRYWSYKYSFKSKY